MSDYLESLQSSLPQIISISALTDCFERIGLLAYRDYCDRKLLEWSGWLNSSKPKESQDDEGKEVDLIKKAKTLEPLGGGDGPEATKTGLARAYELMRADATTIILLYTDAPPHTYANGELGQEYSNLGPELDALKAPTSYGGRGPNFADWVMGAKTLSKRIGDKKAQVFCILDRDMGSSNANMGFENAGYYNYLSTMTSGACFYLQDSKPGSISKVTVEILLAWMGAEKPGAENAEFPAYLTRYVSGEDIKKVKDEQDPVGLQLYVTQTQTLAHSSWTIANVRCRLASHSSASPSGILKRMPTSRKEKITSPKSAYQPKS
jgi:hypothetical protein